MESQDVLYTKEGHIATITLNRPDSLNSLSRDMLEGLTNALEDANADGEIRVLILTGAGKAFCAGLDLKAQASGKGALLNTGGGAQTVNLRRLPPNVLHEVDKPVICAINGAAAGYGFDLTLGCDIRIASINARMGAVFTKRGIVPESGGTWYLPRLLGWGRAAEVAFSGRVLSAEEALAIGLVNRVVAPERLMPETLALAQEYADNAPLAMQATKRMMRLGLSESFEANVHHTLMQLMPLMASEDFKEGVSAFLEKRKPDFKGR